MSFCVDCVDDDDVWQLSVVHCFLSGGAWISVLLGAASSLQNLRVIVSVERAAASSLVWTFKVIVFCSFTFSSKLTTLEPENHFIFVFQLCTVLHNFRSTLTLTTKYVQHAKGKTTHDRVLEIILK
jgi:hypothetical protein